MEKEAIQKTVNLPRTDFPIRAGLKELEPKLLAHWTEQKLYAQIQNKQKGKPFFILHDGPPYPNGDIHMGHALNKILKDFIVKSKTMQGFSSPYIPGWDCHGLPIESQLLKELQKTGEAQKKADIPWFREKCKEYALGYVAKQRSQFERLGILGDWENPYLTLNKEYEAGIIKLFGQIAENGYLYQGRKPIHWCPTCQTALAEAEIEYEEHKSPSVYVAFPIATPSAKLSSLINEHSLKINFIDIKALQVVDDSTPPTTNHQPITPSSLSLLVWTTTPWTLPANVAVAVHPDFDYVLFSAGDKFYIALADLLGKIIEKCKFNDTNQLANNPNQPLSPRSVAEAGEGSSAEGGTGEGKGSGSTKVIAHLKGSDLATTILKHPFYERTSSVVTAEYVTAEDGTGAVHIAPGHGYDDYLVGLKYKLPMIMPVDNAGKLTEQAGAEFAGQEVWAANKLIGQKMEALGTLLRLEFIKHPYPHCWRCHGPVIFRATKQWFIAVDLEPAGRKSLRALALNSIKDVRWVPAWGEKRITAMLQTRPDWCISRQRCWGVPIPVFYCAEENCQEPLFKGVFNQSVIELVSKHGTSAWFTKTPDEILPKGTACPKCGCTSFSKETAIMDVWLESGSSHASVLKTNPALRWPAEMYLEGSDQHRGWFQSSLLASLGGYGALPYKEVLTHGFIVDEKGEKMSKSRGNVVDPLKVTSEQGADVLRWWVALTNFKDDVSIGNNLLKQAQDSFSKVRNTIRFLISNLYDFDPKQNAVAYDKLNEIDRWALLRLYQLDNKILRAYNDYEFHTIAHAAHDFCAVDLSALYLDMVKDLLYCDGANSATRRSTQTVLYIILHSLVKLLAPLISFTAEDIYRYLPGIKPGDSVHLQEFVGLPAEYNDSTLEQRWEKLLRLKDAVNVDIEALRNGKIIRSSLEAQVEIVSPDDYGTAFDLAQFLIVSKVTLTNGKPFGVKATKADGDKCPRCWKVMPLAGDGFCQRCANAIFSFAH